MSVDRKEVKRTEIMRLFVILLSIISCQSINNETFNGTTSTTTKTTNFTSTSSSSSSGSSSSSSTSSRSTTTAIPLPPHFLPLHSGNSNFELNESFGGSSSSSSTTTTTATNNPTARSRIIETKYGKVQGLSITLFPHLNNMGNQHHSSKSNPLKNKLVEVFLNIPYASPPIKSYRFSPTQTPIPWDGVRSAIKPGFVCPQMMPDIRNETAALKDMPKGYLEYLRRVEPYLRNQSEDCLYLNVYTPIGPEPKLRPVLVFIHGGKFSWGSGNLSDGTVLSAYADVVFVTLNYRLGVLGFLNANSSPTSKPRVANYGLMDQIAALHWIKENIMFFGGDPENITLMGYEAGAACIHYLMSSPAVMPGLFHRSILIAGSSHAPWALVSDPAAVAVALADALNCSLNVQSGSNSSTANGTSSAGVSFASGSGGGGGGGGSSQYSSSSSSSSQHGGKTSGSYGSSGQDPILDCLKNKHFSYFSKLPPPKFSVDFGPSIDGVVIKPGFRVMQESQIGKRDVSKKYDLLFGLSSVEMMTAFSEDDLASGFEAQRRDAILRTLIRNSYRFHLNEILATITNEYIDWEKSVQHPITTRDLTLNAVTDCLSLAPVVAAAESQQSNKAFFYVFDHATKDGLYNYQRSGAAGGEELNYLFGYPLIEPVVGQVLPFIPPPLPNNYTKSEMALSELLITFLSNFVHSGDPNEPLKTESTWPISKERVRSRYPAWESYDRLHQKYLEISANKIRSRSHYRAHQMAIWLRLIPELQRSGAHYASSAHNRLKGGNNVSLYVGSLRLPQEEEALNNPQLFDLGYGDPAESAYNGNPPSPPTTCLSPLSSSSASGGSGGSLAGSGSAGDKGNETASEPSYFSPYSTALSATIAIGCSLLILNVFIFALVYYQRDKKRAQVIKANQTESEQSESQKYGEPPELLKSNSTTTTTLHQVPQSDSQGHSLATAVHSHSSHQNISIGHRGILLSPQQAHSHHQHQIMAGATATLPRSNGGVGVSTLPKPPPPPRSFSNFSTLPHKVTSHHSQQQQQQQQQQQHLHHQQQQQHQQHQQQQFQSYTTFDELKV